MRSRTAPRVSPAQRDSRYVSGDLDIDNGATERANRDIALGRGNWTFFGSDNGGKTAAVLLSFITTSSRERDNASHWFSV